VADEPLLRLLFSEGRLAELRTAGLGVDEARQLVEFQYRGQIRQYQSAFPDAQSHVIVADGQPVGRLLVDRAEGELRIVDIAVLAAARGQGIGSAVLRSLQHQAAVSGRRIAMRAARGSLAQRLYSRLGFSEGPGDEMYVELSWETPANRLASIENRDTMGAAP